MYPNDSKIFYVLRVYINMYTRRCIFLNHCRYVHEHHLMVIINSISSPILSYCIQYRRGPSKFCISFIFITESQNNYKWQKKRKGAQSWTKTDQSYPGSKKYCYCRLLRTQIISFSMSLRSKMWREKSRNFLRHWICKQIYESF